LKFNEYQELARSTAIYPAEYGLVYTALGLAGESGEVAEKVKKLIRDGDESGNFENALASELGDVLWYLSNLASEIGMTLEEIATINTQKLQDRKSRGVLQGSGDDR
jgi:NTP pyrophosphatase (non-canonical NTP hydrolase)|tara:strand:+ start:2508 stop:2828 length:321 start_codon:yes stop_codon:yes gene_type:complete